MSNTKPVVLLFQDDYERVKDWVLSYPDSETGGQMFGLWTQDRNPYINIITGPGKNCRHGTHSFHQDIDYLKSVGTFLNTEFMMCHIGEWHSHHRLRLRQPSSGDLNSIWKHFPAGVEYFLLIIATIENDRVRLNPWLFTASSHTYDAIEVKIMNKGNVFMRDEVVANKISCGAETPSQPPNPPIYYYPSTQTKTSEAPVGEYVKPENDGQWFHSDWGVHFVQLLNSKLEKMIDASTTIEKTLKKQCLQISFQRKKCSVLLIFPQNFPNSALVFNCKVLGDSSPVAWDAHIEPGQDDVDFVNHIVDHLKEQIHAIMSNKLAVRKYHARNYEVNV
ncbi:Hypothetical predicted protein [Paramuricea clavata]|uniref:Uncharacterized protein n=1 Tax=Paramuricea clavata TaxID=317549 RepID=A0A7D9L1H2_PARCT|nr:Hypothetical predicted protein [Paramuricea clavata]